MCVVIFCGICGGIPGFTQNHQNVGRRTSVHDLRSPKLPRLHINALLPKHCVYVCMVITYSKSMDQPGKVANPARGQLNRENNIPLSPCVPENLISRDGFSRPVPRQPAHLHTQTESGAYLRDSSRVPRRRPFMKPPYAIGSVPSLSGHAIAYRWRSLPRVHRHRASKPQGSSERVLPWQITMDQLISASLSHTHYWYELGMLKVRDEMCPRWASFSNSKLGG